MASFGGESNASPFMTGKSRKRACVFYNFDSITTMKKLLAIISLWRYNMAVVSDLCLLVYEV